MSWQPILHGQQRWEKKCFCMFKRFFLISDFMPKTNFQSCFNGVNIKTYIRAPVMNVLKLLRKCNRKLNKPGNLIIFSNSLNEFNNA